MSTVGSGLRGLFFRLALPRSPAELLQLGAGWLTRALRRARTLPEAARGLDGLCSIRGYVLEVLPEEQELELFAVVLRSSFSFSLH